MKTIFASALVATTLFAGAAFASADGDHNGAPVMKATSQQAVTLRDFQAFDRSAPAARNTGTTGYNPAGNPNSSYN